MLLTPFVDQIAMNIAASYSDFQHQQKRNLLVPGGVVLFHVALVYALVNGLGHQVIEVIKAPLEVALISEIKPPPPPKVVKTPQPRVAPAPAFVPRTEIPVQAPPSAITTSNEVRPEPPPAPPAPVRPAQVNIAVACPNHQSIVVEVPKRAITMGLSGQVVAEFTVSGSGEIKDIAIVQSSNPIFNAAASNAIARYHCVGQGRDVRVRVPFVFKNE